jgi:predicted neuraminidase
VNRPAISLVLLIAHLAAPRTLADDSQWKLQPLKYNHPGLVVDLGVGLWAYPLPLDYDGDGDLDLLVSSPDKPSQGTYYFENPSQDPRERLPVFKPGVRLGNGYHDMLLSRIGEEPVVLKAGLEYRRDPFSHRFDFSKARSIDAPSNPHSDPTAQTRANMWRYVDYDGDGDHDIVVGLGDWTQYGWDHAYDSQGRWCNGPLHGYLYLLTNTGSDEQPVYDKPPQRLRAGGGQIDVYGRPCPNFGDFDGDGDLDLLCGEFLDGFTYFQNTGSRTAPAYAAGQKLLDADGKPLAMHLQMITPTAVDWDADGDLDLVVGDEDGRVALVENSGELRDQCPVFKSPVYFRQQADTLKFGALATPVAYDWDADGDEDILCGNTAGEIGIFENLGSSDGGLPKWDAPRLLNLTTAQGDLKPFRVMAGENGSIQGPCEAKWGYTTFSVADWDGDGDPDIVYNSILAKLGLLLNDSGTLVERPFDMGQSELPPVWYWWQAPSGAALTQWRTTPLAIDFDGDDQLDLVLLDQQGFLTLRSAGGKARRVFVDEDNRPLQLNAGTCGRSGRVKLAVVDWDGDARLDLLVNSQNAAWYRNCETRDGKIVLKKVGNLARRNVAGHTSSPAPCDFNQDGKPDLLVGSENGRIYHISHEDTLDYPAEQIAARQPARPETPRLTGLVAEEFVFREAPFPQCHASTLCQTTRGLVAAWFGGSKEGRPDVGIWTSYHDGQGWSAPVEAANGVQYEALRYPCWNPVLYQPPGDAPTWLFFKVGPNPREWWGEMMVSYDRGRTFVNQRRLPEGIVGPVRCQPILLTDGETLLCGASTEYDGWRVHFESVRLVDGTPSRTWSRVGPIHNGREFQAIQPTFLTHAHGRIQALCRTREGVIATSISSDEGLTWSPMQATHLPNPNSGIAAVTLQEGRHLLVYNPLGSGESGWGERGVLSLAISDDGSQWKPIGELEREEQGEFSYPSMIQTTDGKVHISYTWNRRRIKHVILDPSAIDEATNSTDPS